MPEYLHPGVYIEEVDAGPRPIEGVSTSTAGFVGVTLRGPTEGKPELVTSFADFVRRFGGYHATPDGAVLNRWTTDPNDAGRWWLFPHAVKAFFDNGGQKLYVKRVFAETATASAVELFAGTTAAVEMVDGPRVQLDHVIGLNAGDSVRLYASGGAELTGAPLPTITALDRGTRTATLSATVAGLRRGVTLRREAAAAPDPALRISARERGAAGNALSVRLRPMHGASLRLGPADPLAVAHATTVDADPERVLDGGGDPVEPAEWWLPLADVGPLVAGDRVRVGATSYPVLEVNAGRIRVQGGSGWPSAPFPISQVRSARIAGDDDGLRVHGANRLYVGALVAIGSGAAYEVGRVASVDAETGIIQLAANLANVHFEGDPIRTIEAAVDARFDAGDGTVTTEAFGNLRLAEAEADDPLFLVNFLNRVSRLVEVEALAGLPAVGALALTDFPTTAPVGPRQTLWAALTGGDDRLGDLAARDFVGVDHGPGTRSGIQALEDIDEVAICAAPGMWSPVIHDGLVVHCEALKDRFAVLDVQDGLSIEGVREARAPLSSRYAALYYPWLVTVDPRTGDDLVVPPSGHAVGIYARVDVARGVHKAPANEVVRGIKGAAQDITAREQDLLNPQGINAIRFFPGRGTRIWGARTLAGGEWKYISVRRLFIFVEESIDEATQWVVFEPNDEPTWARVRQSISNFLNTQWRNGALQGKTADQAFFVKCDFTTMTQDDIDNGRLICVIGIAPVKPAEFVIFRFQQKTLEATG